MVRVKEVILGGFCGAVEFWVREKKSWGYGGFVLLSQLRQQQLRGLPAIPEREFPSGMPLSSIVPALVLQLALQFEFR